MPINSYPLLRAVLIWGETARAFCASEEDHEIIAFLCFTGKPVAKTQLNMASFCLHSVSSGTSVPQSSTTVHYWNDILHWNSMAGIGHVFENKLIQSLGIMNLCPILLPILFKFIFLLLKLNYWSDMFLIVCKGLISSLID